MKLLNFTKFNQLLKTIIVNWRSSFLSPLYYVFTFFLNKSYTAIPCSIQQLENFELHLLLPEEVPTNCTFTDQLEKFNLVFPVFLTAKF